MRTWCLCGDLGIKHARTKEHTADKPYTSASTLLQVCDGKAAAPLPAGHELASGVAGVQVGSVHICVKAADSYLQLDQPLFSLDCVLQLLIIDFGYMQPASISRPLFCAKLTVYLTACSI